MKIVVRWVIVVAAVLLGSLPVSIFVTVILYPLWSWIEATYAIESVGHSGPAQWCFVAIYAIAVSAASVGAWRYGLRKQARDDLVR